MPARLATALQIPSDNVPNYDEVVITSTITPVHFAKEGEEVPSGNIEVGDTLATDENGDYIKTEKYAVHYMLLLAGVVVYKGHEVLEGADLLEAMTRRPNARTEYKNTGYDVLEVKGIKPANAIII